VIVKFTEQMGDAIEKALPASLVLPDPGAHVRRDWFRKHSVEVVRPLFAELVRQKRARRTSAEGLADEVRTRYLARSRRAAGTGTPDLSRTYLLELPQGSAAELAAAVERLRADAEVVYAQLEQSVSLDFTPNDPYFASSGSWGQSYADQWDMLVTGAPAAWDSATGQGMVVAVVDTGVDPNHLDLAANVWINSDEIPSNGVDDDHNGYVDDVKGWDFAGVNHWAGVGDNAPADLDGHGTHIAGTIAAVGHNGVGMVGLAWGARVMPVRCFDNSGSTSDAVLANGILYAASNGADVINNSYGASGFSQVLWDAIGYARSLGVVVVASAGNSNSRVEDRYPAGYPGVITVAGSRPDDGKVGGSNWGSKIDVAAPGEDVLSLRATGTSAPLPVGTQYQRMDGTSMAAPHVSALAALVLSRQPQLTPEQVRQAIRFGATDLGAPGPDDFFGHGRMNAAASVLVDDPLEAKIMIPGEGGTITLAGPLDVYGVAQGPGFSHYVLDYGAGESPAAWTVMAQGTSPVGGGELGIDQPNLPDGRATLRLRVFDAAGRVFTDRVSFIVDYMSITAPAPPTPVNLAIELKPGAIITIAGTVFGSSASPFAIEWAPGPAPTGGWSADGVTVTDGGTGQVVQGMLGQWDTTGITEGGYYTIRLTVSSGGTVAEERTLVYLEPDLLSPYWPQYIYPAPAFGSSVLPFRDAYGTTRLAFASGGFWDAAPPMFTSYDLYGMGGYTSDWLNGSTRMQPAIAELDGLAGDEAVFPEGNVLRVFHSDLTSTTIQPAESVDFTNSQVILEDLDGDGQREIIALGNAASTAWLYAWKSNGQLLGARYPIPISNLNADMRFTAGIRYLVLDLNADGLEEIVVAEGDSASSWRLRCFNWDGTAASWAGPSFPGYEVNLAAGDLEGDGVADIAVGYVTASFNGEGRVQVTNADGTMKAGWPLMLGLYQQPRFAIGDVNGDGLDELVVSAGNYLYALRANGAQIFNAPCNGAGDVVLADLDGDGAAEILTERRDPDLSLVALRGNGSTLESWPMLGLQGYFGPYDGLVPAIGDFDGDGRVDIAVWYRLTEGGSPTGAAALLVLTPHLGGGPQALPWPINHHDARSTTRAPISAVVNPDTTPPSVAISSPAAGAAVSGTITVTAVASDDVGVAGVQFQLDGANLGAEVSAPPYQVSWATAGVTNGGHTLSAVARDRAGNRATSGIPVTVNNDLTPPAVSIASPASGASVAGTITLSASASDDVGVVGVQFKLDGADLGAEVSSPPYTVSWSTTSSSIGPHTLTAVARDAAGNSRTSSAVNVIVANPVKINFQPASAPTYAGYLVDSGAVFGSRGNGLSYGWNASDASHTADRNSSRSADQRYDTLITTQSGGTFTWEMAVPNGRYRVHLVAGDASFTNSVYKYNAEGALTVSGTPSSGSRWVEGTSTVTVSDGRLTVGNASGASNNKLCFLEITAVP
jgi:subtilisin family serine protease